MGPVGRAQAVRWGRRLHWWWLRSVGTGSPCPRCGRAGARLVPVSPGSGFIVTVAREQPDGRLALEPVPAGTHIATRQCARCELAARFRGWVAAVPQRGRGAARLAARRWPRRWRGAPRRWRRRARAQRPADPAARPGRWWPPRRRGAGTVPRGWRRPQAAARLAWRRARRRAWGRWPRPVRRAWWRAWARWYAATEPQRQHGTPADVALDVVPAEWLYGTYPGDDGQRVHPRR